MEFSIKYFIYISKIAIICLGYLSSLVFILFGLIFFMISLFFAHSVNLSTYAGLAGSGVAMFVAIGTGVNSIKDSRIKKRLGL